MIFLYIALPLAVAAVLPLLGKASKKVLPDLLGNATLAILLFVALSGVKNFWGGFGNPIVERLGWFGETVNLQVALDGFSQFMLLTVQLVSLAVGLFSVSYMDHYGSKANYYALLLVMVAGMNGLLLSTDLFNVYIFLEVAAVASYALVAYGLEHDEL